MAMAAGFAFICIIFGTTFMTIKIGLNDGCPPFFMAAVRFELVGLLLLRLKGTVLPRGWSIYAEIGLACKACS